MVRKQLSRFDHYHILLAELASLIQSPNVAGIVFIFVCICSHTHCHHSL
jgi:hypothetical protein